MGLRGSQGMHPNSPPAPPTARWGLALPGRIQSHRAGKQRDVVPGARGRLGGGQRRAPAGRRPRPGTQSAGPQHLGKWADQTECHRTEPKGFESNGPNQRAAWFPSGHPSPLPVLSTDPAAPEPRAHGGVWVAHGAVRARPGALRLTVTRRDGSQSMTGAPSPLLREA